MSSTLPSSTSNTSINDTRFAHITPDNHAAWIWIPTLLAICYSFTLLGFRSIVKRRGYAVDDAVLGIAYIAAVVHWIFTLKALSSGLGKSTHLLAASQEQNASLNTFAARFPLFVAICLSKCSVVLLVRFIFCSYNATSTRRACNIILAVLGVSAIIAVTVLSARCSYKSILAVNGNLYCSHQNARWKVVVALDIITEVVIFHLVVGLTYSVNVKPKAKFFIVMAFSTRLPNIFFSLVTLSAFLSHFNDQTRSLHNDQLAKPDPSLSIAIPSAWLESMLGFSLISATTPCLTHAMKRFRTGGLSFSRD